jgi:hypothetical protein
MKEKLWQKKRVILKEALGRQRKHPATERLRKKVQELLLERKQQAEGKQRQKAPEAENVLQAREEQE